MSSIHTWNDFYSCSPPPLPHTLHPTPPPYPLPLPQPSSSFFPFLPPSHFPSSSPICFPPHFGFFSYPYPPPPPLPLPSPSPLHQGSNQDLHKQPTLISAPLTIPSLPSIETSLNIPPKPLSSVLGSRNRSFNIDANFFSFSFDGGRSDSYAIHETRRNVKSSIWVSRRGMEWILTCLEDIRD